MKNPRTLALHDMGQCVWLDNITRQLLQSGTLARYIRELSVTGLTSNPTIFEHAIGMGTLYDERIRILTAAGMSDETLFFELALEDLTEAATLFWPIFEASQGTDGWVSLEVSPLLAHDATGTIRAAARLHAQAACANLLIKIPGTPEGIVAIEQSIFAGIPVNVTLLFSCDHYLAAAHAYMRGLERRAALGLDLAVGSVASLFVSRWDVAADKAIPGPFRNRLGIAIASCSRRTAGRSSKPPVPVRSACFGPARAPRIRRLQTPCTSRPWRPMPRLTRSRRRRCWLLRTTGR
jgi:transaldolase